MSDYSVFKVQLQRKELSVSVRCGGRTLSFQVVAAENGVLGSDFKKFFEKFFAAVQLALLHRFE